jgi:hypothetical protein
MPLAFAPPVDRVVIDCTASYNIAIVDCLCLPFVVLQRTASHRIIALGTARLRLCVFRTAAAGQNSLARHFIFRKGSWPGWRSVRHYGSPGHQFRSIVRCPPPPPPPPALLPPSSPSPIRPFLKIWQHQVRRSAVDSRISMRSK